MSPKECASLLVEYAKRFSFYDQPNEVDEIIYILAWYLWDMVDQDVPEWTEALGRELDRLRPGITSKGSHERFAAYSEAKEDQEGGGPVWRITRTFQSYVLGEAPLDFMQTVDLSTHLMALMNSLQKVLVRES